MALASAHDIMHGAFARAVAPRRPMLVSQWAEKNRRLSDKGSAEPFPWRNARNPLQIEIMDCASARSKVTDVVAILPIQFGKSEMEMNIVGYTMMENPMPIIVALPSEVSLNKLIDQKINPLIDETPALQNVLVSLNSRETSNRRTFKDFEGGQLYIEHAGAPVRLKSTSAGMVLADEFSSFANELKSGDDPEDMLDGRTTTYMRAKRFKVGTPETVGNCRLTDQWDKSDKRRFHVACPDCGHAQPLVWAGLQWTEDLSDVWYCCRACASVIREHQKTDMIADADRRSRINGEPGIGWVPERPEISRRGYTANGLYYPAGLGLTWRQLAEKFVESVGDPAKLKTFINDRLAEAWEDASARKVKDTLLRDRAEPYRLRTAPHGVLAITAGVDTQDNRLAVTIQGWGRGLVNWTLDYVELPGDPAEPEVWNALTDLLNRPLQHACGAMVRVEATAIDAGGHRTEDVKHYTRQRLVSRPMAIFGSKNANAPVLAGPKLADVTWNGKTDKHGAQIYQVGTTDIKHRLYAWLGGDAEKEQADRRMHFSDELEAMWFGGIVSETWNPRSGRYEKKRGSPRNEPLDTWVYAYAALHHKDLRLHRATVADWDARERRLKENAEALGVRVADSRETAPPAPAAPDDVSRESTAPAIPPPPPPPMTVRSVVFALVGMAERHRGEAPSDETLEQWSGATAGGQDGDARLHLELLESLKSAAGIPSALPRELLDRARRYLSGLPVAYNMGGRKRPLRGTRSKGVQ